MKKIKGSPEQVLNSILSELKKNKCQLPIVKRHDDKYIDLVYDERNVDRICSYFICHDIVDPEYSLLYKVGTKPLENNKLISIEELIKLEKFRNFK